MFLNDIFRDAFTINTFLLSLHKCNVHLKSSQNLCEYLTDIIRKITFVEDPVLPFPNAFLLSAFTMKCH